MKSKKNFKQKPSKLFKIYVKIGLIQINKKNVILFIIITIFKYKLKYV